MKSKNSLVSIVLNGPGPKTRQEALVLYFKAICMGIADLIPGVSGGTIAFITGIYSDLLAAIASINGEVVCLFLKLKWKECFSKLHTKFVIILAAGIFTSFLLFSRLMHYLITEQEIPTWGFFFGLIVASIIVLYKEQGEIKKFVNVFWVVVGTAVAYILVSLIPVDTPEDLWFIFICGSIGISAMILPGISGSFLLLILGKYEYITAALKNPFGEGNLQVLLVFMAGVGLGLLSVAKLLNYFIKNKRPATMAFLTGIMIGSLKKVWPWKEVVETKLIRGKLRVIREENIIPPDMGSETFITLFTIVVGFVVVILMEKHVFGEKAA